MEDFMDLVGCVAGGGEGGEVVADGGGEPGMGLAGGGGGGGEEFDDAADEGEGVGELVAGEVLQGAAVEVVGFGVHGVVRVAANACQSPAKPACATESGTRPLHTARRAAFSTPSLASKRPMCPCSTIVKGCIVTSNCQNHIPK